MRANRRVRSDGSGVSGGHDTAPISLELPLPRILREPAICRFSALTLNIPIQGNELRSQLMWKEPGHLHDEGRFDAFPLRLLTRTTSTLTNCRFIDTITDCIWFPLYDVHGGPLWVRPAGTFTRLALLGAQPLRWWVLSWCPHTPRCVRSSLPLPRKSAPLVLIAE